MHKQLYQQHGGTIPKQNTIVHSKDEFNSLQTNTVNIIEFLTEEFKRGLSYNSLISVRSALGQCFPYCIWYILQITAQCLNF